MLNIKTAILVLFTMFSLTLVACSKKETPVSEKTEIESANSSAVSSSNSATVTDAGSSSNTNTSAKSDDMAIAALDKPNENNTQDNHSENSAH